MKDLSSIVATNPIPKPHTKFLATMLNAAIQRNVISRSLIYVQNESV